MRLIFTRIAYLIGCLILISTAYWPGLSGPFMFDDFPNIVENQVFIKGGGLVDAAFSTNTGPLSRPISMITLWLNYKVGGVEPWGYKCINLFIHCLSVIFAFFLIRQLLSAISALKQLEWVDSRTQFHIALLASLLWGIHPINLSSVLYVVQRMTSLSGMFALLGLALYCWGRNKIIRGQDVGWGGILIACLLLFPLAIFSKENNLVWPLWIAAIEWLVFGFAAPRVWQQKLFKYAVLATGGGLVLVVVSLVFNPDLITTGYIYRDFTLTDRLLTQSRVLWHYSYWILVPQLSIYGLYHDDLTVSTSFLHPWATGLAVVAWVAVVSALIFFRKRYPWACLAGMFFLIGHLIESTVIPLEMMHEHRNYIPGLAFIVVFAGVLVRLAKGSQYRLYVITLSVLIVGVFWFITNSRAYQWASLPRLIWAQVQSHPYSPRANYEAGVWYYDAYLNETGPEKKLEYAEYAQKYFSLSSNYDVNDTSGLVGLLWLQGVLGVQGEYYPELLSRVRRVALGEAKGAQLIAWYQCILRGECQIEVARMNEITQAVLDNPRGAPRVKGRLAHLFGLHLAKLKNTGSPSFIELAISYEPGEGEYWIALIHVLLESGNIDDAKQVYARLVNEQHKVYLNIKPRLESYHALFD